MSDAEVVAFSVLWCVTLGLGGLVLLLYRQVERAYATGDQGVSDGLPPGSETPEIEVICEAGSEVLAPPAPREMALLAFVTTECQGCLSLLTSLGEAKPSVQVTVLVSGEDTSSFRKLARLLQCRWLAHPPDVTRAFGVTHVPHTYVVRGTTVLASGGPVDEAGIEALIDEATVNEQSLSSGSSGEIVASLREPIRAS